MKKILSLLSMLMVTVMAFATDYTDQLTFKLTLSSSPYVKSLPEGTLTVEKRVDGTYNVTACGCDFSTYGFENWGDLSCDGVEGTTDADGLTTIQVTNPEVSANGTLPAGGFSLKGESLLVKFNETKAYALLKGKLALNAVVGYAFEYTFGTDEGFEGGGSTGGGETGGEVTEKYTVNFDKTAYHSRNDRVLSGFSLQQTGKDKQTVNVFASRAAYEDHTSSVFNVEAGSELTASFNYSGQWMNGYIYIDRDNDGEFSYKEGQWDQAGTDLVAYSFYSTLANPKVNDGNGYNSTGASVSGNDRSNVNPPSFTAPTEPGTYRIRFKIDWNCILPGGSNDILSDGGGVWDATLNVVAAKPEVKEEKSFTDDISMVVGDMSEVAGQAQVTIKEMTDETISMTLAVVGQEGAEYTASGFTKAVDTEKNRTTYTGSLNVDGDDFDVTALVYTEGTVEKLYMVAKGAEYNYVVGTNPDAPTVVSDKTYTSNLRIYDGEEPVVEETEAQVNVTMYSDDTYKITLKDVSMLNQTSDLVFVGKAIAEETDSEAPRTIMAKSDGATTNFFGEEMNASFELTEVSADEIKMDFALENTNFSYTGQFNYEVKTPAAEPFCKENYVADGNGFEWEIPVDWDTQKIVMSIDPSTCTGSCEHVIGLGAVPTAWVNTLNLYRTSADQMLQGYFQNDGGNHNTGKFAETTPFLVEVSKAQGFVVNGEVKIAASEMSELFDLSTVKMGTGEGVNDKSRATYNYVKVVDKDWTKDPETGINATTVAEGEFEVFSVDGVKLSKLQKGLNIVRSADGKVKKVLVK